MATNAQPNAGPVAAGDLPAGARVLVTGATGFTGQALLRKLCARPLRVRALARGSSARDGLADLPVE